MTSQPERVAVFGGSFDPPHVGHVLLAAWAVAAGGIDRLLVVPTYAHPFSKRSCPFEHRIAMAELAFSVLDPSRVEVSRIEERLAASSSEPSYTARTLEALTREHPATRFRLLVGADVLGDLHRWREVDRIEALAPLLIAGRAGYAQQNGGRSVSEGVPSFPQVSSTDIRARLDGGLSVRALVPDEVIAYLQEHALYTPEGVA